MSTLNWFEHKYLLPAEQCMSCNYPALLKWDRLTDYGSSSNSKQSLCGEQWRLLSSVPDPSWGARTHLWVPRSFPDCPSGRCDPMPSHVHQHPVQMCKQWTVCQDFLSSCYMICSIEKLCVLSNCLCNLNKIIRLLTAAVSWQWFC